MYNLDPSTDAGAYILGILWGTMGVWEEGFWLRHRDRWYIETVRDHLGLSPAIQEVSSATGPQYRIKIVRAETVREMKALLQKHGWTPRKDSVRPYPLGNIDDRGFVRAWVELHSNSDIRRAKHRNGLYYPQPRLRIYGNAALMEGVNLVLAAACNLQPRKLQNTTNTITKALYYQGKNVLPVLLWLYEKADLFNAKALENFRNSQG